MTSAGASAWYQRKTVAAPAGRTPAPAHAVTVAEVEEIAAIADPVRRNLRITLAYHDLAVGMAGVLGGADASWCCFGTWASRTPGRSIRSEATPKVIRTVLAFAERVPPRWRALTPDALAAAVRQVAVNVAHGNLIVFQDLGLLHARMLEAFAEDPDPDRAARRCREGLRPGPVEDGGQDLLIAAVDAYRDAALATDPGARAERVLLANLRIGLHEQIRLQGRSCAPWWLRRSTASPPARCAAAWTRPGRRWPRASSWTSACPTPTSRRPGSRPPRPSAPTSPAPRSPPELSRLRDVELKALLYDLDRTPNTVLGSAAGDWSDLADRMNFVADLFRAWQREPRLLLAPFTPGQEADVRAGRVPAHGPPL